MASSLTGSTSQPSLVQPIAGFDSHVSVPTASIQQISRMAEVGPALESADENTLVIWDIDRTLVGMGDQLLVSGKSGFKKRISAFPAYKALSKEEQETLLSIVIEKTSHRIIEPDSLKWIENLKERQIKTMACTTLETGKFGIFPRMQQWRVDSLNHLGINFKSTFPELDAFEFYPGMTRSPVFQDGVLIASKRTKGEVIKMFLERLSWQPNKIIVVDDQHSALESVVSELKDTGIKIQGVHYTYVAERLKYQALNNVIIDFQLQHLLEHRIWLTDEEALEKLQ